MKIASRMYKDIQPIYMGKLKPVVHVILLGEQKPQSNRFDLPPT